MPPNDPIAGQTILTLEVQTARAEEVADWIRSVWETDVVELQRPGHARCWLEIYFPTEIQAGIARQVLQEKEGVVAAQLRQTTPRDWASFWRHHFRTQDIGSRLRICPVWEKDDPAGPGRVTVFIDPGLSFGTGDHFTTRFCLEMIDRLCQKSPPASLLDVGTGSGILAVAAARLGCPSVLGVDHDPQCMTQAAANAALNDVTDAVEWRLLDAGMDAMPGPFDAVCANLFSDLLIELAPGLAGAARSRVILSGIRETQMDVVAEAYAAQGARELVRD
ncbi:MAG TPA: 50S ribosomal protein L11 methyltransferase, partial [Kiritimatiellia bacterium]